MPNNFRKIYEALKESLNEFMDDNAMKLSASLAYYTIFSVGPLLLVIISLLSFFYKKAYVTDEVYRHLSNMIGAAGATQLQQILNAISRQANATFFGIAAGIVLVFSATGIFTEIQGSINYLWSVRAKPKRSWLKYLTDRLLSLLLISGMGLLLIFALLASVVIDLLSGRLRYLIGNANIILLNGGNFALLFFVFCFLFWIIFKVLPDARVHWKDALTGAVFTSILFIIGKYLISWYYSLPGSTSVYGAAASIILLLSWVYYCAIILYFGAKFTEVYARKWGKGITVSEKAVYIIKRETSELPVKSTL